MKKIKTSYSLFIRLCCTVICTLCLLWISGCSRTDESAAGSSDSTAEITSSSSVTSVPDETPDTQSSNPDTQGSSSSTGTTSTPAGASSTPSSSTPGGNSNSQSGNQTSQPATSAPSSSPGASSETSQTPTTSNPPTSSSPPPTSKPTDPPKPTFVKADYDAVVNAVKDYTNTKTTMSFNFKESLKDRVTYNSDGTPSQEKSSVGWHGTPNWSKSGKDKVISTLKYHVDLTEDMIKMQINQGEKVTVDYYIITFEYKNEIYFALIYG